MKSPTLGGGAGRERPPLGRVKASLGSASKIQKANATPGLPTAPSAISVSSKKKPSKKIQPSMQQKMSNAMLGC